jgi:hypothetical protein
MDVPTAPTGDCCPATMIFKHVFRSWLQSGTRQRTVRSLHQWCSQETESGGGFAAMVTKNMKPYPTESSAMAVHNARRGTVSWTKTSAKRHHPGAKRQANEPDHEQDRCGRQHDEYGEGAGTPHKVWWLGLEGIPFRLLSIVGRRLRRPGVFRRDRARLKLQAGRRKPPTPPLSETGR